MKNVGVILVRNAMQRVVAVVWGFAGPQASENKVVYVRGWEGISYLEERCKHSAAEEGACRRVHVGLLEEISNEGRSVALRQSRKATRVFPQESAETMGKPLAVSLACVIHSCHVPDRGLQYASETSYGPAVHCEKYL